MSTIELTTIDPTPVITFTFHGELNKAVALRLIQKWTQYLSERPVEKHILVWDAREMTGYEPAARTFWQKALKENSPQTEIIYLISDKRIIRLGATLMSAFSKLTIKAVATPEEVELPVAMYA